MQCGYNGLIGIHQRAKPFAAALQTSSHLKSEALAHRELTECNPLLAHSLTGIPTFQLPRFAGAAAMDAGEIFVALPSPREIFVALPSPRLYKSLTFRRIASTKERVPPDEEMQIRSPKSQDDDLKEPFIGEKKTKSKAPALVLGFECLESTAFNGIATNLVVYLETLLHGSNLASASNVTTWFGTSYLTPVFGAIIADTFWGNYNTILVSLIFYLLGMMLITFSAFLPTTALCAAGAASCQQPILGAQTVAFLGLYLVAFGSGGVRAALLPFGADQFDDENATDRERKMSFFSWFYLCVDFGMIVSGLFIVWIQQNVSWGLGFGIATACIAVAFAGFVLATPMFKRRMPTGTPLKSLSQVVVAAVRKARLRVPADTSLLYEVHDKINQSKIAHTDEFAFLDKAAVVMDSDLAEESDDVAADAGWKVCTVTQVEELKILIRLLPIWATSIVLSAAYAQLNTTFVQQGAAMDMRVLSFSIPAASMVSFEVLCVLAWVLIYDSVIVPMLQRVCPANGEPSQLQRMGAGRLLMAFAMGIAALLEMARLEATGRGQSMGIAWQMPQYFALAGGEVFCYIAQLEFFYSEAPESMKSMCTSLALLTVALGSYMSSFIYAVVNSFTAVDGRPGWISDNLNEGHLDYFFWVMAALCMLNFVVYSVFARTYKVKTVVA
uniref:Major facilitator superfamily (MFS) profile domain-containing protein n=1 Tax=Leersia perrieri TaxID=77586 RepID=A0A0D9W8X3_9ORYZ